MDKETEDRIVLAVIERVLTLMPDVIGNLMSTHATNNKIKENFFNQYPEFAQHKELVASVVEGEDGKELGQDYKKILDNAVPIIRQRIQTVGKLNTVDIPNKMDLKTVASKGDNGEL